jgi:cytochrome-b5 reductase
MYQLIKGIFADSCEKTKVTLIFGVNTNEDILFRDEFAKYEEQFPGRFKAVYTVSNPSGNSPYHKGRITKDLIRQVMPDSSRASDKIFVCGPPTMEASLLGPSGLGKGVQKGILEELGYTKDQVHKF